MIEDDRAARLTGAEPMTIPMSSADPAEPAALPGADNHEWLTKVAKDVPGYRNE